MRRNVWREKREKIRRPWKKQTEKDDDEMFRMMMMTRRY